MNNIFKYIAIVINICILVCTIFIKFESVLDVVVLIVALFMLNLLCYLAHGVVNKHNK